MGRSGGRRGPMRPRRRVHAAAEPERASNSLTGQRIARRAESIVCLATIVYLVRVNSTVPSERQLNKV